MTASPLPAPPRALPRKLFFPLFPLILVSAAPSMQAQFVPGGISPGGLIEQAYLPPIGGPGGGQFQAPFGPGQYLTGVQLHAGDDVDAISPVCAGGPRGIIADAPFVGGTGGALVEVRCPFNDPTVLALDVAAEGAAIVVVNNIHLFCGKPIANQTPPAYPSAIFDGPSAVQSKPAFPLMPGGSSISTTAGHEVCPAGQYATGIHGRSGIYLDAVGLICAAPPPPPPAKNLQVASLGRVKVPADSTPDPVMSICDRAADARARKSPAAPYLEAQCSPADAKIAAAERADLTPGASGTPISICDAAQAALNHGAPEAADLSARCRATGAGQNLLSEADQLAPAGAALADSDPLMSALRDRQPDGPARHGFDVGIAATGKDTQWGPGKQRILDSLPAAGQEGFKVASSFAMDRNRNPQLAAVGATIAANDPAVAAARTLDPDARYWLGFDIASGLFGDPALGSEGSKSTGQGSQRIQAGLSPPAQKGFIASTKFHLSRSY
jgi:hypothetical protein